MTDRELHDRVIRALADAEYRHSEEWSQSGLADQSRVEKFSRFLARHFYYERVVHFFKYSRALSKVTGRSPEQALAGQRFEKMLPHIVIGSQKSADEVSEMVADFVSKSKGRELVPYLDDLLEYEKAMMIAEAGPRDWSEEEQEDPRSESVAEVVEGTRVLELDFDLPEVFPAILGEFDQPPKAQRRKTRLLLARSRYGRVTVMTADERLIRLMEGAGDRLTLGELAKAIGLPVDLVHEWMKSLADAGAVRFYSGS